MKANPIQPFNSRRWLRYFGQLLPRFKYARMIGLPHLRDNPDVPLERLYVPLYLGTEYVPPEKAGDASRISLIQAMHDHRRLVVLGDPGAGKSTVVNYLTTLFSSYRNHAVADTLGHLIPLPFVLRDYPIDEHVTFDALLDAFQTQPFWPETDGPEPGELREALESGQALILLDGLDEIGNVKIRRALRDAVLHDGLKRFPNALWVLTSRIVGYEDAPFDAAALSRMGERQEAEARAFLESMAREGFHGPIDPVAPERFYLLPFNREQIESFVKRWYVIREADPHTREESAQSMLAAIDQSESLRRLAPNPNLLTLMTLIHRVYSRLPSGRAMLYDKITEAYLESIDTLRGIRESVVPEKSQRRWLAMLAYDMQKMREVQDGGNIPEKAAEILVGADEVKERMRRVLGESHDLDKELGYIARRSGLLLPRKPGFYNFVHLSFQEYFAALYLYEGLMSFDRRETVANELISLKGNGIWKECLIFLFEMISSHDNAANWLFDKIF